MARAPGSYPEGRRFDSYSRYHLSLFGRLAQLGEHLPYKQEAIGSSPIAPTIFRYMPGFIIRMRPGSSVG